MFGGKVVVKIVRQKKALPPKVSKRRPRNQTKGKGDFFKVRKEGGISAAATESEPKRLQQKGAVSAVG